MRSALVAIALAACTEAGVYIEVVAPADVEEVELYLGERECKSDDTGGERECDELRPDTFARPVRASIFIRDRDEPYRAIVENGSAWFRLGVEELATMPRVVAIGRTDGSPTAAAVVPGLELGGTRKVIIVLADAPPWQNDETFSGPGVMEWAEGRCIGVHGFADDHLFIVPGGDPDCDAVAAPECDPLGYLVQEPTGMRCLTAASGACTIGTQVCTEALDGTDVEPCLPGETELPASVCALCPSPGLATCIEDKFRDSYPRMVCDLAYDDLEGEPVPQCREGKPGRVPAPLIGSTTRFCPDEIGIADLQLPLPSPADWRPTYESLGWTRLDLMRDVQAASCWALDWRAANANGMQVLIPDNRTLVLQYLGGDGAQRPRAIPLELRFNRDCESEPHCRIQIAP